MFRTWLLYALVLAPLAWSAPHRPVLILTGLTILDGQGHRYENASIQLHNGRIERIYVGGLPRMPAGFEFEDWSGHYAIPGLIDSHAHLFSSSLGMGSPYETTAQYQVDKLQSYLGFGVTSIVSLADSLEDVSELRAQIDAGRMRGPRVFFSGPAITGPGGHPVGELGNDPIAKLVGTEVKDAVSARAAVQSLQGKVDLVKLVLQTGLPTSGLSPEAYQAAVATAHELGMKVTTHIYSESDLQLALKTGTDGIEHTPAAMSDETLQSLLRSSATWTPTLVVNEGFAVMADATHRAALQKALESDPFLKTWARFQEALPLSLAATAPVPKLFADEAKWLAWSTFAEEKIFSKACEAARSAGQTLPLLAGTDASNAGSINGYSLIRELELFVEHCKLSPDQALISATSRAADRLGRPDLGRIAAGAAADLVILDSDPSQSVKALRAVKAVYRSGERVNLDTLFTTSPGPWVPRHVVGPF